MNGDRPKFHCLLISGDLVHKLKKKFYKMPADSLS